MIRHRMFVAAVALCGLCRMAWGQDATSRIEGVEVLRAEDGALVFKLSFDQPANPDRVRILLDVDGPVRGEMITGADYMLEGQVVYRYPPRASGWKWDAIEPAVSLLEENSSVFFFPRLPSNRSVGWAVELLSDDWTVLDRRPESGLALCEPEALPLFTLSSALQPEDVGILLSNWPRAFWREAPKFFDGPDWQSVPESGRESGRRVELGGEPPLLFSGRLRDAVSRREFRLEPETTALVSNRIRWTGSSGGISWVMVLERESDDALVVSGRLAADRERCVRVGVGLETALDGAVWHDDFRFRRELSASSEPARTAGASASYGLRGRPSWVPFGVLTTGGRSIQVETDPDEPRAFEIEADPARSFFGIQYDLALTAQTSNFPGEATFRCRFRIFPNGAEDGFRKALTAFYKAHPAFWVRNAPVCGFGRPLSVAGFPRTVDFACDETDLFRSENEATAETPRWMSYLFIEPWSFWLKASGRMAKDEAQILRRLKVLAAGTDRAGELAAGALSGGARRSGGSLDWREIARPWHTGLFLRVSADPRRPPDPAAPLNKAMAEWRYYQTTMRINPVHGLFIEPAPDEGSLDYNPAALGLSDYPATFETNSFRPGLAGPLSSCPELTALAASVRAAGGFMAGAPSILQWPFAAPSLDVLVQEVETWTGGEFDPVREGRANLMRALAGAKPLAVRRSDPDRPLNPELLARHLEWCMFRAFLPAFFDRVHGADRIWTDALMEGEIRRTLNRYLPLIRRLAAAGWQPLGRIRAQPESLWIEHFGAGRDSGQLTVRNTSPDRVRGHLIFPASKDRLILLNPLNGEIFALPASKEEQVCPLTLMPLEIGVRHWFAESETESESEFLQAWVGGGHCAAAALTNLASLAAEQEFGALCNVFFALPAVQGDRNEIRLEVANVGEGPLGLAEIKVISPTVFRPLDEAVVEVPPGETRSVNTYFETADAADDAWLEVEWALKRGDEKRMVRRIFKPGVVDALAFDPPAKRIEGEGDQVEIPLRVRNYSNRARTVALKWEGDFLGGRREISLPPDSTTDLRLPVKRKRGRGGEMFVEAQTEGQPPFQAWFDVVFR